LKERGEDLCRFTGDGSDRFRLGPQADNKQGLVQFINEVMTHWDIRLLLRLQYDAATIIIALPLVERLAHPHSKEAKETIHIEVIRLLITIPDFLNEDFLSLLRVPCMLDLPYTH